MAIANSIYKGFISGSADSLEQELANIPMREKVVDIFPFVRHKLFVPTINFAVLAKTSYNK